MSSLKDEFKKYKSICQSIEILEREIFSESLTKIVGDTYRDYRTGEGIIKKISGLPDMSDKKKRLNAYKKRKERIEQAIEGVTDDITRQVLKLRYLHGLKWNEIAKNMGDISRADYYRLVVHDNFFRKAKNRVTEKGKAKAE